MRRYPDDRLSKLDRMIDDTNPAYAVMGREYCAERQRDMARQGDTELTIRVGKYQFSFRGIPVIVCFPGILEVTPDAREVL
jgi:hypothetical protein